MASNFKSIAIIGAGPAGCLCASFASKNNNVTLFDFKSPLHTLLYTGGGRCNLAYAEYDFKELAKFYPRGEKFLYSIFSRFSTQNTLDFFKSIGIETYTQKDLRIFPKSNSAKEVRDKLLNSIKNCEFKNEKVSELIKENNLFKIKTENNIYNFDAVVIAIGGHAGFSLAQNSGHNIIPPKPALTGLITEEDFKKLQGVSLQNISAQIFYFDKKFAQLQDDILFTHNGISGPLAYKISSICARLDYNTTKPIVIKLDLLNKEIDIQSMFNLNPKKDIKTLISEFIPKSFAEYIVVKNNLQLKCHEINSENRTLLLKNLREFSITAISPAKEGEIVTSGGICLDEINPKTMESKLCKNMYFCGEVIDVDGFCGGFNLQNCWSTGYIAGSSI